MNSCAKSGSEGNSDQTTILPSLGCDREFDLAYPDWIQKLSDCHWTPVEVARKAARFLVTGPETRILDVGCGPGKFCAVGAATTEGHFTGIEQRGSLVSIARRTMRNLGLSNKVQIIRANITEVEFRRYDAFYLFNPFHENIFPVQRIDATVELDRQLYDLYTDYVKRQLALAPLGTRVATFHGNSDEIPHGYEYEHQAFGGYLKLWIKNRETPLHGLADRASQTWEKELCGMACA